MIHSLDSWSDEHTFAPTAQRRRPAYRPVPPRFRRLDPISRRGHTLGCAVAICRPTGRDPDSLRVTDDDIRGFALIAVACRMDIVGVPHNTL